MEKTLANTRYIHTYLGRYAACAFGMRGIAEVINRNMLLLAAAGKRYVLQLGLASVPTSAPGAGHSPACCCPRHRRCYSTLLHRIALVVRHQRQPLGFQANV
jgi:hypothetical protein